MKGIEKLKNDKVAKLKAKKLHHSSWIIVLKAQVEKGIEAHKAKMAKFREEIENLHENVEVEKAKKKSFQMKKINYRKM